MAREGFNRYNLQGMHDKPIRKLAAELSFILAFFLMLLGSVLLIGTIAGAPRIAVLPASLSILLGSMFAIFAIKLYRRALYLFLSAFFLQVGILLLLVSLHAVPASIVRLWPFISLFAGTSLLPAGWHQYGGPSSKYLVPAIAFVVIGSVLLVFSLKVVSFSFKKFFLDWWPLFLVIAGLILTLISVAPRDKGGEPPP